MTQSSKLIVPKRIRQQLFLYRAPTEQLKVRWSRQLIQGTKHVKLEYLPT